MLRKAFGEPRLPACPRRQRGVVCLANARAATAFPEADLVVRQPNLNSTPVTCMYVRPDGRVHTQANLAGGIDKEKTWQQMLMPPPRH